MATDLNRPGPISARIEATEKLYNEAELGASADAVLRALDPMIERRLGQLLDQFSQCAPELGPLLDLRAKISELWRMRKEVLQARDKGRNSWERLQAILLEKGALKPNGTGVQSSAGSDRSI